MKTTYSNLVNLRVNEKEIVLNFYAHFPDNEADKPPDDQEPEAIVVMNIAALEQLSKAFSKAIEARNKAQAKKKGGEE